MADLPLIIAAAAVVVILMFSLGWSRAARFRSGHGKAPWTINPAGWGLIYALLLPVGWLLYSFASRTTVVVDPSLVNRGTASSPTPPKSASA